MKEYIDIRSVTKDSPVDEQIWVSYRRGRFNGDEATKQAMYKGFPHLADTIREAERIGLVELSKKRMAIS